MNFNKIYVGSWYPRTLFHLNELYHFLDKGETELSLDKDHLDKLRERLSPKKVSLNQDLGQSYLLADFDKYSFESKENGLTVMSLSNFDNDNLEEEMAELSEFAFKNVFSSLSYLFSLGAPIPKVFTALKSVMPFVLVTENSKKEEIESFLKEKGQKICKEFENKDIQVYYGETIVVINGDAKKADDMVKECIYYLHDAESQFHRILNMHRFIWEEVSSIKSAKVIKYKDLSHTRDLIMEIESEVVFFKSRIEQLDKILNSQLKRVERISDENDVICLGFIDGFNDLIDSGNYIKSLWTMTEDYLSGASKLVSTVYQESSNKQINTLQFVFIISAVAAILSLGAMVHTDVYLTTSGNNVTGITRSFDFRDLFQLGGLSVIVGSLIYFIWGKLYQNFAGSKISDPKIIANEKLEKIKKMLG